MKKEILATKEELAVIQKRLSETTNDPNCMFLECHCFSLNFEKETTEQRENNCRKCPVRIDFIKRNPNNIYNQKQ